MSFSVVYLNSSLLAFCCLSFSDVDIEAQFSINQSRADEITMREDYGSLPMNMHDDGFGEIGFDTPDLVRDGLNPTIDVSCRRLL